MSSDRAAGFFWRTRGAGGRRTSTSRGESPVLRSKTAAAAIKGIWAGNSILTAHIVRSPEAGRSGYLHDTSSKYSAKPTTTAAGRAQLLVKKISQFWIFPRSFERSDEVRDMDIGESGVTVRPPNLTLLPLSRRP